MTNSPDDRDLDAIRAALFKLGDEEVPQPPQLTPQELADREDAESAARAMAYVVPPSEDDADRKAREQEEFRQFCAKLAKIFNQRSIFEPALFDCWSNFEIDTRRSAADHTTLRVVSHAGAFIVAPTFVEAERQLDGGAAVDMMRLAASNPLIIKYGVRLKGSPEEIRVLSLAAHAMQIRIQAVEPYPTAQHSRLPVPMAA